MSTATLIETIHLLTQQLETRDRELTNLKQHFERRTETLRDAKGIAEAIFKLDDMITEKRQRQTNFFNDLLKMIIEEVDKSSSDKPPSGMTITEVTERVRVLELSLSAIRRIVNKYLPNDIQNLSPISSTPIKALIDVKDDDNQNLAPIPSTPIKALIDVKDDDTAPSIPSSSKDLPTAISFLLTADTTLGESFKQRVELLGIDYAIVQKLFDLGNVYAAGRFVTETLLGIHPKREEGSDFLDIVFFGRSDRSMFHSIGLSAKDCCDNPFYLPRNDTRSGMSDMWGSWWCSVIGSEKPLFRVTFATADILKQYKKFGILKETTPDTYDFYRTFFNGDIFTVVDIDALKKKRHTTPASSLFSPSSDQRNVMFFMGYSFAEDERDHPLTMPQHFNAKRPHNYLASFK